VIWLPVAIIVLALIGHVVLFWMRRRRSGIVVGSAWIGAPPEECTVCALDWVGKRDLHVISATFDESREFGAGAGSSLTAYYCADHCPGGCDHEKEHAA
jgi:hypothetical protein